MEISCDIDYEIILLCDNLQEYLAKEKALMNEEFKYLWNFDFKSKSQKDFDSWDIYKRMYMNSGIWDDTQQYNYSGMTGSISRATRRFIGLIFLHHLWDYLLYDIWWTLKCMPPSHKRLMKHQFDVLHDSLIAKFYFTLKSLRKLKWETLKIQLNETQK